MMRERSKKQIMTTTQSNPKWWTNENDSAWERVKAAFKRDWDQTKHDMGGDEPETNQKAGDTLKQAAGKQAIPPRGQINYEQDVEPAYRFGYGARSKYGTDESEWNDATESQLKQEWTDLYPTRKDRWQQDRESIRYGWDYDDE